MAIRLNPSPAIPNTREHFSHKSTFLASPSDVIAADSCCFGCALDLMAIANLSNPTDPITNDRTDFIVRTGKGTTTVGTLTQIAPDGTETDIIITDDTYGQFYPTSTIKFIYWAFELDWYKVANTLGFGRYKFNVTATNVAATVVFNETSPCFTLIPYSCENAHDTVVITTEQKGYFEGFFDYTGLDYTYTDHAGNTKKKTTWRQSIRLYGRFFRSTRDLAVDNIVSKQRGQEQVQASTVKVYTLQLDMIQTDVSNRVIDDMLLAPDVRISAYFINNIEDYVETRVSLTDLGNPTRTRGSRSEFYPDIELKEYFQDNLHRYR